MIPRNAQLSESQTVLSKRATSIITYFPTGKEFAISLNIDSCALKYAEIKTTVDALKSQKIKLFELTQAYGEQNILYWIESWLVGLSLYMDFEINEQQSKTTAMFILEDCYMFNIPELTLLFNRIKKGHYGNFYGKFNGQIIMDSCVAYRNERGLILSKLPESEQNEIIL